MLNIKLILMVGALLASSLLPVFQMEAHAKGKSESQAPLPPKLDNETCLSCHDKHKNPEKLTRSQAELPPLRDINGDKFVKSVHSEMQCITCHADLTDTTIPHTKGTAQKPDCVSCHQGLWETAKKDNLTKEKARLGIVVDNIENYKNSYHSRPNKEDKTHVNATCDDCHDTHTFNVPSAGTSKRSDWHLTIPNVCGEKCHSDELDEYSTSVHGKQVLAKHNPKAAVCTDCHTTHGIANTSKENFKVAIAENCGNCHSENLKSYRDTYHGQVNKLGYGYTAKCYDCHGSHGILSPKDPASKVHPDNRLKTCQGCHKEATKGFTTFNPHATTHDKERYPQMWFVSRFMWTLLAGVFIFFWLHTGLWWYREAKDRKARKNHPDQRKG